jgi:hypothetical protein
MAVKAHFSTKTNKWEECHAAPDGKCPYSNGGHATASSIRNFEKYNHPNGRHVMLASIRDLEEYNKLTNVIRVAGMNPDAMDMLERIESHELSDDEVNEVTGVVERMYASHYRMEPLIVADAAAQPASNVKYLYANGDGTMTIKAGSYYYLQSFTNSFVDNEDMRFNLREHTYGTLGESKFAESCMIVRAGLVNGRPCYDASPLGIDMENGIMLGSQLIPSEVVDFYGIDVARYRGRKWTFDKDQVIFSSLDLDSIGYTSGRDYAADQHPDDRPHDVPWAELFDSLQQFDEQGHDWRYRPSISDSWYHVSSSLIRRCGVTPENVKTWLKSTGKIPDLRFATDVDYDGLREVIHVIVDKRKVSHEAIAEDWGPFS